jgi:hypothetical protein
LVPEPFCPWPWGCWFCPGCCSGPAGHGVSGGRAALSVIFHNGPAVPNLAI